MTKQRARIAESDDWVGDLHLFAGQAPNNVVVCHPTVGSA